MGVLERERERRGGREREINEGESGRERTESRGAEREIVTKGGGEGAEECKEGDLEKGGG